MEQVLKVLNGLTPQAVALLIAGGLIFALITLYAPPEVREWLYGANGLIATIVALLLRSPQDVSTLRKSGTLGGGRDPQS